MAASGHESGHGHGATKVINLAGATFLVLAIAELFVGVRFANPAIRANGAHDALDGFTFLIGGTLIMLMQRSLRHSLACTGPKVVSMAVVALVVGFTSLASILVHDSFVSTAGEMSGIIMGVTALVTNLYWRQRLGAEAHGHSHAGFKFDLLVDMGTSAAVVAASLVTIFTHSSRVNSVTAILIVVVVIASGVTQIALVARSLHAGANHTIHHDAAH